MEVPDILHTVWIGVAKDAVGSLLMDFCDFGQSLQFFGTWDERLQAVTISAREWCRKRHLAPSVPSQALTFEHTIAPAAVCEDLSKIHSLYCLSLVSFRLGEALRGCCVSRLPFRA